MGWRLSHACHEATAHTGRLRLSPAPRAGTPSVGRGVTCPEDRAALPWTLPPRLVCLPRLERKRRIRLFSRTCDRRNCAALSSVPCSSGLWATRVLRKPPEGAASRPRAQLLQGPWVDGWRWRGRWSLRPCGVATPSSLQRPPWVGSGLSSAPHWGQQDTSLGFGVRPTL